MGNNENTFYVNLYSDDYSLTSNEKIFNINFPTHSGSPIKEDVFYYICNGISRNNVVIYNFAIPPTEYLTRWKTDNAGTSNDNQILLPLDSSGTYDFTVYWGDENSDHITAYDDAAITHTYGSAGTYDVIIDGTCYGWRFNNGGDKLKILNISNWGTGFRLGNLSGYFYGCANLTVTALDILDLTNTTKMDNAFKSCSSLTTAPTMTLWDTSNLLNTADMFRDAILFNQDISSWNLGKDYYFINMFYNARLFNQNIGNWNMSNATNTASMFLGATVFNQDISSWDVSKVIYMNSMFSGANSFNQDISGWDVSKVTNMSSMFRNAGSFNQDISGWDVSGVRSMSNMFYGATSFNQNIGGVAKWDTGLVTNMTDMFTHANSFDQNIANFDVTALTNATNMFRYITLSTANYDALLIGWEAQAVQDNVIFNGGNSKYTAGGAAAIARQNLIDNHTWTITDGGTA